MSDKTKTSRFDNTDTDSFTRNLGARYATRGEEALRHLSRELAGVSDDAKFAARSGLKTLTGMVRRGHSISHTQSEN